MSHLSWGVAGRPTRRSFLRMAGAAGVAAAATPLVSSCAATSSRAVRVVVLANAADRPLWTRMVSRFQQLHPDIEVQPISLAGPSNGDVWTEFFSAVQTRIVGGENYDLVYVPTEGQLLFASRNVMEPLDEYMRRDASTIDEFQRDVDRQVLNQFASHRPVDGKSYYVPIGENCTCMLYNRRLFRAAGVPEPDGQWTWDEFERAATAVHRLDKKVYAISYAPDFFDFTPWLLGNSASVLNSAWTKSTIDTPAAAEAISFARSFVARGMAPQPGGAFDAYSAMLGGKLAMMNGAFNAIQAMRQQGFTMSDYAFVPFPHHTRPGTSVGYGAFGMFKVSNKKDAAWEFVKFAISQEFQDFVARTGFLSISPVRRSSATGPGSRADAPAGVPFLYQALSSSTLVPGLEGQARIAVPFDEDIAQMLAGTMDVHSGLKTLNQQIAAGMTS